jgi:hypothetical protein
MNAREPLRAMVSAVVLVCLLSGFVWAGRAEIEEKLSKDIQIQLKDVSVGEALKQIGKTGGIEIVLSDGAEWKLPRGAVTKVSVVLDGPLGESLTEMLNVFFMRYAVGEERVTIYPRPELGHIIGRPSTEQLELLKKIYVTKINVNGPVSPGIANIIIKKFIGEVSFFPHDVPRGIREILEDVVDENENASLSTTFALLLDQVCDEEYKWYIAGTGFPGQLAQIRLVHEEEFREAKLDQIVEISVTDERADVILQRLSKWAGMELLVDTTEPGWLGQEEVSVTMQNVRLRQAIRSVVSTVDGVVEIGEPRDDQITVAGPVHTPEAMVIREKKERDNNYVGKISIPMNGGAYYIEFMLRESDLTDELRKLWHEKLKSVLQVPKLYDMSELEAAPSPEPAEVMKGG